jgi:hypothetical protein
MLILGFVDYWNMISAPQAKKCFDLILIVIEICRIINQKALILDPRRRALRAVHGESLMFTLNLYHAPPHTHHTTPHRPTTHNPTSLQPHNP